MQSRTALLLALCALWTSVASCEASLRGRRTKARVARFLKEEEAAADNDEKKEDDKEDKNATPSPSLRPTASPAASNGRPKPTARPTTPPPTFRPSSSPTVAKETDPPTQPPSAAPFTAAPSEVPTTLPTTVPPSGAPSSAPSKSPSLAPTAAPSEPPSLAPTGGPTGTPSAGPTADASESPTTLSWLYHFGGGGDGPEEEEAGPDGEGWPDEDASSSSAISDSAPTSDGSTSSSSTSSSGSGANDGPAIGLISVVVVSLLVAVAACWGACILLMQRRKDGQLDEAGSAADNDDCGGSTSRSQSPCPSDAAVGDEESGPIAVQKKRTSPRCNAVLKTIDEDDARQSRTAPPPPKRSSQECHDVEKDELDHETEGNEQGRPPVRAPAVVDCSGSTKEADTQKVDDDDDKELVEEEDQLPTDEDQHPADEDQHLADARTHSGCHVEQFAASDRCIEEDSTATLVGNLSPIVESDEEDAEVEHDNDNDDDDNTKDGTKPPIPEEDGFETASITSEDMEYMYGTLPMDKLPSTPKRSNSRTMRTSPDSVILEGSPRSLHSLSLPHDGEDFFANDWRADRSSKRLIGAKEEDVEEDEGCALYWL